MGLIHVTDETSQAFTNLRDFYKEIYPEKDITNDKFLMDLIRSAPYYKVAEDVAAKKNEVMKTKVEEVRKTFKLKD